MNPWEPAGVREGDYRVTGVIAGVGITGHWEDFQASREHLHALIQEHGCEWGDIRIESRREVQARAVYAERERLRKTKARLDATGALTVAQAARELRRRKDAPPIPAPVWVATERPPYASVKHALGDYAAHCHGGKLSQLRLEQRGGVHCPAWLCVGSAMARIGLMPDDCQRDNILRWACTADDRRGTHTQQRLSGREWVLVRELRELLKEDGVIAAGGG